MSEESNESFDWIQIKKDIGSTESIVLQETSKEKLIRKIHENPFVPIGALATAACLTFGLYSFQKGNSRLSQIMMRGRILAQGFTIVALVGGIISAAMKNNVNSERR